MDAFLSIAVPVPAEETETSQIPADYDTSNGGANSNCTIA
ncbi:fungal pheromone precursor [Wolfiporia cocos MD-104 SS10]|uniref:Fungal pheromone n=1 Tax=Wolfiporia cocos (strain MD-104) TaxID=742152 RepID=A0A2H3JSQ3_WOLCO|nr:fungal pheromone precursor [Wolfiporia cocos MD-104 SS10]